MTPWTAACQASLSITNSQSLLKLMYIESVTSSNCLISSSVVPFSSCLQSFLASWSFPRSQFFASDGQIIGASDSVISPANDYAGLISFRMDCLDFLAVQGTLKSSTKHSSKASTLQCSAFFIVQLSHPYMTTGKTTALTRQTFLTK